MSLSLWYEWPVAWFGKFNHTMLVFGLKWSEAHHLVYCHTTLGKCVLSMVYVDDTVLTENDTTKISTKGALIKPFSY